MTNSTDVRCTSLSEDGRRCHGDVGHPGTHWAAASRVWSDAETLVRPPTTQTLAEFILQRIAEDEAVARAMETAHDPLDWTEPGDPAVGLAGPVDGPSGYASIVIDPARVLAECEAKRRVIQYARTITGGLDAAYGGAGGKWVIDDQIMRALASVYADHPDFRDEWRP